MTLEPRRSKVERWWIIDGDQGTDWGTDETRVEAARERGDFVDGPFVREAEFGELYEAAGAVWAWVGPGYPDLDDPAERSRFMEAVSVLAMAWFVMQVGRS